MGAISRSALSGLLLLACAFVAASCGVESEPSSTAANAVAGGRSSITASTVAVPTTSVDSSTTTTTVATPATASPAADPALVFPGVDTGVAASVRQLTVADQDDFEALERVESPDGAVFILTSCTMTWPNRWKITGDWTAAVGAPDGPTDWVLGVAQQHGDVIAGGGAAAVTLVDPGTFTVPMVFDELEPQWRREQETSHEYWGDRPFQSGAPCVFYAASDSQPVAPESRSHVDSLVGSDVQFVPPVAVHSEGSLQHELEAMTDPAEHWLGALAWHVGLEGSVPMDVLYLRPGVKIRWIQITHESTCIGASIAYVDEVITGQGAGCPPGADPIDRFGSDDLVEMPGGWLVGVEGIGIEELVAYPWEGSAPTETSFDPSRYAATLSLPEDHRIVAEFEFGDGLVLMIEQVGDPATFYVEELFTGGGEGYVGGGPGETWQGCWRVDYSEAGYAIVLTEDRSWTVRYAGEYVLMKSAGDVGAGLIEGHFDRLPAVDVRPDPDSGC